MQGQQRRIAAARLYGLCLHQVPKQHRCLCCVAFRCIVGIGQSDQARRMRRQFVTRAVTAIHRFEAACDERPFFVALVAEPYPATDFGDDAMDQRIVEDDIGIGADSANSSSTLLHAYAA